jgi:ParB-like chromosome segregation protein Spo0J
MGWRPIGVAAMDVQLISLSRLRAAPWNANRVPRATVARIRRSLEEFGVVENLSARPHPSQADLLEVISGNHRLEILRELGYTEAPVVVVELDDALARILAQTLNRTRGKDDPLAYRRLLEELLMSATPAEAAQFLPEAPAKLEQLLLEARRDDLADANAVPSPPAEAESRPGEVYELGPHRLLCGDATDPAQVELLVGTERPEVVWTDPPYGVGYVGGGRAVKEGTIRKPIANDTPEETQALLRASLAAVDRVLAQAVASTSQARPAASSFGSRSSRPAGRSTKRWSGSSRRWCSATATTTTSTRTSSTAGSRDTADPGAEASGEAAGTATTHRRACSRSTGH